MFVGPSGTFGIPCPIKLGFRLRTDNSFPLKDNYYRNQKQRDLTIARRSCGRTSWEGINDAREPNPEGHPRTDEATDTP